MKATKKALRKVQKALRFVHDVFVRPFACPLSEDGRVLIDNSGDAMVTLV